MMHTLFSTNYWVMRESEEHQLVALTRTHLPYESRLDAVVEEDRIRAALAPRHKSCAIIVDLRLLTNESSAKAETGLTRLFAAIIGKFARVAVLHRGAAELDRVFPPESTDGAETLLTTSETAAHEFARLDSGQSSIDAPSQVRMRIPTENPGGRSPALGARAR